MSNTDPKDRAALGTLQREKFRRLLGTILPQNPFWARRLSGATEFERIPFTTKRDLIEDQEARPPYGTNLTYPRERYVRLHQTSGTMGRPLRWLDDRASWDWILECWRRIYETVGLRPDDRLFFAFSYGPFLGFWAALDGAQKLDRFCMASGGMTTSGRLRAILENEITVVCATPTYALRMAEVAEAEKLDLAKSPVRTLIVAGEPGASIPSTRSRIESVWGARLFDHYGMTEIGSLGIECVDGPGGFHLLETECIAEIVDPASGRPVQAGQEGELVLTNLGRVGSPLLRYRTGDLVSADPAPCPCGRAFVRLRGGILGRADDLLIVRGTKVYPSALEAIVRRFPEVDEFRIVAGGGELRLEVEVRSGAADPCARLVEAVRAELLLRPDVALVAPGSLPRAEMKSHRVLRVS